MKITAKVPEKKAAAQASPPKEPAVSIKEIGAELSRLHDGFTHVEHELWEVVGPVSLVSHALLQHGGNEELEVVNLNGVREGFTVIGMASADVLEVYASKIYSICNRLDILCSQFSRVVDQLPKPQAAPDARKEVV